MTFSSFHAFNISPSENNLVQTSNGYLFVAVVNGNQRSAVLRSTDGGATWSTWAEELVYGFRIGLAVNGNTILLAKKFNYSGVYVQVLDATTTGSPVHTITSPGASFYVSGGAYSLNACSVTYANGKWHLFLTGQDNEDGSQPFARWFSSSSADGLSGWEMETALGDSTFGEEHTGYIHIGNRQIIYGTSPYGGVAPYYYYRDNPAMYVVPATKAPYAITSGTTVMGTHMYKDSSNTLHWVTHEADGGNGQNFIRYSKSTDSGNTWSAPVTIYNGINSNWTYTSVSVAAVNGTVVVLYRTGSSPAQVWRSISTNNGTSWSALTNLGFGEFSNGNTYRIFTKAVDTRIFQFATGVNTNNTAYEIMSSNQPPNPPTITSPAMSSWHNVQPTYVWTFSDPDAGNTQAGWWLQRSHDNWVTVDYDTGWQGNSITSHTMGWSHVDANNYVRIKTRDASGAESDWAWHRYGFDNVMPTSTDPSPQTQYLNIPANGTFRAWIYNVTDSPSGVQSVKFPTSRNGIGDWVWRDGVKDGATNNWYCDIPISGYNGGAEAIFETHIYVYDNAGNNQHKKTVYTHVDRTAPISTSVSTPQYTNGSGSVRIWVYGIQDNGAGASGISHVMTHLVRPDASYYQIQNATISGSDAYVDVTWGVGEQQGQWTVDFRPVDRAGNTAILRSAQVYHDRVGPNNPNSQIKYEQTTTTITWDAFSDTAPSSGYKETRIHKKEWNGSAFVVMAGDDTVISTDPAYRSHPVTGLVPGKKYKFTITWRDRANNLSAYTEVEFTTKKQFGSFKAGTDIIPVYDPTSGVLGTKALRTGTASGVGCFELVPTTDPKASKFRVNTPQGIKSIAKL